MQEIIFVYNADSDFWSAAKDVVIKTFTPAQYACNLCAISHGVFGPRAAWLTFLQSIHLKKTFLHRDEFHALYPDMRCVDLPAIFLASTGSSPKVLIAADRLNKLQSIAQLQDLLTKSLAATLS